MFLIVLGMLTLRGMHDADALGSKGTAWAGSHRQHAQTRLPLLPWVA